MHWVAVVYKVHGMGVIVSDRLSGVLDCRDAESSGVVIGVDESLELALCWEGWDWLRLLNLDRFLDGGRSKEVRIVGGCTWCGDGVGVW
jgi:hypothetical protein